MPTGIVNVKKPGYGFIKCDDGSADCFLLPTALVDGTKFDTLPLQARVEFERYENGVDDQGRTRWRARNVKLIES